MHRSVNVGGSGCKESSATLSVSDACSLSTSDCYDTSTRNDIDADLSRVSRDDVSEASQSPSFQHIGVPDDPDHEDEAVCTRTGADVDDVDLSRVCCNMDEHRSDCSRSPPNLGIPDAAEDDDDKEEACTRAGATCRGAATTAMDGAATSSTSSSFSIWNILQATTRSSKREQSSPGYKTTWQSSLDYKATSQHSSPGYKTPQQALSLYAGDGFTAWRESSARQLLMQAVITQPLGFQVERLATTPL